MKNNLIDLKEDSYFDFFFKEKNTHGSNWALLFLIVPITCIVLLIFSHESFPLYQLNFFLFSLKFSLPSYIFFWILSYRNAKKDKILLVASFIFFMFWFFSFWVLLNQINVKFDHSEIIIFREKVITSKEVSGGKSNSGHCLVELKKPILELNELKLKRSYCENFQTNQNGIEAHVKYGFFDFPYLVNYSVIKNFDYYMYKIFSLKSQ